MASTADAAAAEAEAEGPAPPATLQEALASDHFSVETLDLSEQDIGVLDDGIARLVRLTELVLFGNRLHVVPHAILRCTMLRKLDLSDNMLARPPLHLLALPQLRELYLKGNPFIEMFDVPKSLDGFPLLQYVKEREAEDCYYGLRARPPRDFTEAQFMKKYTRNANAAEVLEEALFAMLAEWGFAPPIDEDKWAYLRQCVFGLAAFWGETPRRLARARELARACRGKLDRAIRRVVLDEIATDETNAGVGAWLCREGGLDERRGDIATAGGAFSASTTKCWINENFLKTADELPRDAKWSFDANVLPHMVACLAQTSLPGFRDALVRALPNAFVEPDPGLHGERVRAPEGVLRVRCARGLHAVKEVEAIRANVVRKHKAAARGAWPFTATIGDALRASVVAPDAAGVQAAFHALNASDEWKVFRVSNGFKFSIGSWVPKDDGKMAPPCLTLNVLFEAANTAPIVAEITVHDARVLSIARQDRKMHRVVHARGIADLAKVAAAATTGRRKAAAAVRAPTGATVAGGGSAPAAVAVVSYDESALEDRNFVQAERIGALESNNAMLSLAVRYRDERLRKEAEDEEALSPCGAGMHAARSLRDEDCLPCYRYAVGAASAASDSPGNIPADLFCSNILPKLPDGELREVYATARGEFEAEEERR